MNAAMQSTILVNLMLSLIKSSHEKDERDDLHFCINMENFEFQLISDEIKSLSDPEISVINVSKTFSYTKLLDFSFCFSSALVQVFHNW